MSDVAQPSAYALYHDAWRLYEARCLWNLRRVSMPRRADIDIVANALRLHGDMNAWRFADRLREAAAAVGDAA